MSRTVVIGASSGLGRCIGVGLAQRGDSVALLARRRERIEAAATGGGAGHDRHRMRRDRRGIVPIGHRRGRRCARRHRQPGLHTWRRAARPVGRYRCRDVAARLRYQRHGRGAHDGGGGATLDGLRGQGGLPLIAHRQLRAALARPGRVRRQQGGAGEARRVVARRTPEYRLHLPHCRGVRGRRGRRSRRDSTPAGISSWPSRPTRFGCRAAVCLPT